MTDVPVVLCFGDSNTHGTPPMKSVLDLERFPLHQRWPGVAQKALGDSVRIIEEAQPGRTTVFDNATAGGGRSGLAVLPIVLESHRPLDCIVLMLGTNDLHAHFNVSAWVIARNVSQLIAKIRQMPCGPSLDRQPEILLVAPPPVLEQGFASPALAGAAPKSREIAGHFEELAKEMDVQFLDAGKVISVDPLDGVHFSAESHRALGSAIAEKLRTILGLAARSEI